MKLGKYQHPKTGNFYRVIGVAKHSETLEELVVYECLYDNPRSKLWVRPKKMFLEEVEINGEKVSRFRFVEEGDGRYMKNDRSLELLVEEAIVDCFGPYEEVWGFQATMDNEMIFPFKASISEEQIEVVGVDVKNDRLVAIYKKDEKKHTIDILKLVYDSKQVDGSEWIDAYREWYKDNESFFKRRS